MWGGEGKQNQPTAAQLQLKRGKGGGGAWRAGMEGRRQESKRPVDLDESGDAAAAAGSRPNPPPPPPHHYWSKDVGKQKEGRELEAAG